MSYLEMLLFFGCNRTDKVTARSVTICQCPKSQKDDLKLSSGVTGESAARYIIIDGLYPETKEEVCNGFRAVSRAGN